MLRVLIVDDEALARARLRSLLAEIPEPMVRVDAEAASAAQALELLRHQRFDLALVDIHMPGRDGMGLARELCALPEAPALVFVSAHEEHALRAFELDAVDYLSKPVRRERLRLALHKTERHLRATRGMQGGAPGQFLGIQDRGRSERLPLEDVVYLRAELKYITVRTAARSYILEGSLNELEERFGTSMLRIHRNTLVLRQAARALERRRDAQGPRWALRLQGLDEWLSVSRRALGAVRELLGDRS